MEIEIEVIGKPNRWVVSQSPIRIGRGPSCEVTLPARQFPNVGTVHAELEVFNGALRLGARDASRGDLYLNDQPVEAGAFILSGDVLRLGPQGPELRVLYTEQAPPRSTHEPTRVMQVGDLPGREPTRAMQVGDVPPREPSRTPQPTEVPGRLPTQVMSSPVQQSDPSLRGTQTPVSARAPQQGYFGDGRGSTPAKPVATPAVRVPSPSVPALAPAPSGALEKSLHTMQILQGASLLVIVILAVMVVRLESQVSSNHDALQALQSQNANAVSQFTPTLDTRLNAFSQRMDSLDGTLRAGEERMERGMDAKMRAAEDQLFASLDVRMKATEDRMVNRMNTDLPPLLDKYINQKLAEIKH
jgi:pSer/pThr/pTyr-binding forkhead associated (FHA) protein